MSEPIVSLWRDDTLPWSEYREQVIKRYQLCGAAVNFQKHTCQCGDSEHENSLHDLAVDDVPALIKRLDDAVAEIGRLKTEQRLFHAETVGYVTARPSDTPSGFALTSRDIFPDVGSATENLTAVPASMEAHNAVYALIDLSMFEATP